MTQANDPAQQGTAPRSAQEEALRVDSTPEASLCSACLHHTYCACRGKTGYCGNFIHRATRVIGGRYDPFRFKA